jgi:hypothetical protein
MLGCPQLPIERERHRVNCSLVTIQLLSEQPLSQCESSMHSVNLTGNIHQEHVDLVDENEGEQGHDDLVSTSSID